MNNSDWSSSVQSIQKYYRSLYAQYGDNPRSCDYGLPESQITKFKAISEVVDLNNKSLLDVGCGLGNYYEFINCRFEGVSYNGIDICDFFIEKAKINNPGVNFFASDIFSDQYQPNSYDVVTANGIFYLLKKSPVDFMNSLISRMFYIASTAVAFNSLSTWCIDKDDNEFYADPFFTLDFCRTLTPWVTLRSDYHSRDFTIYMFKNRQL
ncbi:MAG: class I SAM-dependent methyltransferase [Synechococcus sp. MIT S9220]|uniref:class I SAM-dependent methyltransferase n=1 Tax=unclassified Synechococcus TaxID=2626047 RepID=UPI00164AE57A|nr:class I SAM-dependent methyltransferase [Synechococcus sp. MIT S9220]NOL48024.1 class I SAM-dependent methyltransferase [Synechococcus sp. MIT S9220]